ncbi:procollagen-lysine,2-oxoglutarate 5-dioxygenase 1-like isoform X1 [Amphibalanus amphitrite]|uniref:procollagen-lysine,2-oxoglutarate 5-dioxygenase 1-like isoform X1 n=1 Tax=Amphibalanus amphitrite TaxID=1232801 RepID=UPI001C90F170|nr:procollagen-lysine,2-oxoglutarate 5-dioxygenase 1-like isoform X1 [Amphibalanus amphitrite]
MRATEVLAITVLCFFLSASSSTSSDEHDFLAITVATDETDGFKRYARSAKQYDIPVKVLGMGEEWRGGDVKRFAGGGHKINILKAELAKYKDDKNKIIMFTDAYDVVINAPASQIVAAFLALKARVVFSTEGFCWPDATLASEYPVPEKGKPYLNSGAFIGYAPELYEIVTHKAIEDGGDDQLYYTKIFLDKALRQKFNIKLDYTATIFQNLNGATADVELRFKGSEAYLQNTAYNTVPLVIHGNGASKLVLNTLGSYLAGAYNPETGCVACWEDQIELGDKMDKYPSVFMAIFLEQATPFTEEFFTKILALHYPKDKLHLYIHNAVAYHAKEVAAFVDKHGPEYVSVTVVSDEQNLKEWHARNRGIEEFLKTKAEYYFTVDANAHLDNPYALKLLIEQNRDIVAPLLVRPYKAWSNFWGSLTSDGFYARSMDYMDIVEGRRAGIWNVPYISACYLIRRSVVADPKTRPNFISGLLDADMAFCENMRNADKFMYVSNRANFGHLLSVDSFETSHLFNEMWQITENRWDWEQRYLHANYSQALDKDFQNEMPCPDVFWFPLVTPRFCQELIDTMEDFGEWSSGTNEKSKTNRLIKYDPVPTDDIQVEQVGFYDQWMAFLYQYVTPLQQKVFEGHVREPPYAGANFVVRYRWDVQAALRPHCDSSTYTINIALNQPGKDYEGGGVHFTRYKCSVTDSRLGWVLMHPGRLTHQHQGLPTTNGTRYIMVSFVDPDV